MRPWTWLFVAGISACAPKPSVVPVIGPDGLPALHVSCADDEARCYQLAGNRCPYGYDLSKTPGEAGNFLVRCRWAQGAWAAPVSPAVVPGSTETSTLAPSPYSPAEPANAATFPPLGPGQSGALEPDSDIGY